MYLFEINILVLLLKEEILSDFRFVLVSSFHYISALFPVELQRMATVEDL